MKKFILDKETNKLIPWSEYIHEKKDPAVKKDDSIPSEDIHSKSGEIAQEAQAADSIVDKVRTETEHTGGEARREIYTKPDEPKVAAEEGQELKESDKVVFTKGLDGPPGERKKKRKVKEAVIDTTDGSQKKAKLTYQPLKKPWISL